MAGYIQNQMPSRSVLGDGLGGSHHRLEALLFVGYCEDRQPYRYLDPETNKINNSRVVRFVEMYNGSMMVDRQNSEQGKEWVVLDWGMNEAKVQEKNYTVFWKLVKLPAGRYPIRCKWNSGYLKEEWIEMNLVTPWYKLRQGFPTGGISEHHESSATNGLSGTILPSSRRIAKESIWNK